MICSTLKVLVSRNRWNPAACTAVLSMAFVACGSGVVRSGVGVGNVGQGLSVHADGAARKAELCLIQDSLGPQSGGVEKSMTETCGSAQKSDLLLRRALQTMSLYGERLSAAAAGEEAETSGKLEAAMTGVGGADWSDAEDQATRDAVAQLVGQMSAQSTGNKIDLNKLVLDASAPIKTLCTSLSAHFEAQLRELATTRNDVDKKSMNRAIRRCGTYESHTVCVADTVVDRMVYAEVFARVVAMENATYDAKDGVARFCAAHDKLAEAAQNGQAGKKEIYPSIVEAVKAVPRSQPNWEPTEAAKAGEPAKAAAPATKTLAPAKK